MSYTLRSTGPARAAAALFALGLTACLGATDDDDPVDGTDAALAAAPDRYGASTEALTKAALNEAISDPRLAGVRNLKPVLANALYRGGGPGGTVPLSAATQSKMCELGFSGAVYHYANGFRGSLVNGCAFEYDQIGFRSTDARREVLKRVHAVITQKKGPILVHCWNGWHASGEIAAIALKQFCGMGDKEAGEYWKANVGDKGNLGKYGSIVRQVENFRPFPDMTITAEEQARVCPQ